MISLGIALTLFLAGALITAYIRRRKKEIARRESERIQLNLPSNAPFQHIILAEGPK